MKTEDAVKMIELCLQSVDSRKELDSLISKIIDRLVELSTPKKREYKKKQILQPIFGSHVIKDELTDEKSLFRIQE